MESIEALKMVIDDVKNRVYPHYKTIPMGTDPAVQKFTLGAVNLFEWYRQSYVIHTLEAALFNQIGSSLETSLYYLYRNHASPGQIHEMEKKWGSAVFQRFGNESERSCQGLMKIHLGVDICVLPCFLLVQEYFVHRHLYVHRVGLVDEKYLKGLKSISATLGVAEQMQQIAEYSVVADGDDFYWWKPLSRLQDFANAAHSFYLSVKYVIEG